MYCENCGKQIEDGSKFCRYCGGKIDSTEILATAAGRVESAVIVNETVAAAATGMVEAGTKDKRKKSKRGLIAAITAVIVTALAVLIGFSIYNKPENGLARALALGQRYLLEENYEQAIVEFNRAIEIDSKNEEAYIGLAEAYVETDELEKAVRTLEKGARKTDSEELQELLERYAKELAQAESPDTVVEAEEAEAPKDTRMEEPEMLPEDIEVEAPAAEEPAMEAEASSEAEYNSENLSETSASQTETKQNRNGHTEKTVDDSGYYIITYDDTGSMTKMERYYPDGSLFWYNIYIYDENGRIVKEEDYMIGWGGNYYMSSHTTYSYSYNSNGNMIRNVRYYEGNLCRNKFETYDVYGNLIKEEEYNNNTGSLEGLNIYDGNGNLIKTEYYNADGSLQYVNEYSNQPATGMGF